MRGLPGDGPDTALARLLHSTQRVRLEVLRPLLERARAGGPELGEALLAKQLLSSEELAAYQRRLSGPVGRLAPGEVVAGRYQVESLLGQGGMGAVYRAREVATGRSVALKVLLPELAEDVDVRRFEVEGELGARIGGLAGFVPVHAAGTHRGLPYLAMGLVAGADLEASIDGLSPEDLARLLAQVARALHAAHEAGVIHRDLKPANILLDERGAPLVADLGLARAELTKSLTQTGEILGTPSYMAPEQIQDPRSVDARSDVYALGAIFYRGLSGAAPFQGSLLQVLDHVLTRPPPPLPPDCPPAAATICLRALAKDPAERYASAAALAADLERYGRGEEIAPKRGGRTGGVAAALAGALLLVAGLLAPALLGAGAKEASPTSSPASGDRRSTERARISRQLERAFLDLAGGKRTRLEPLRRRAERGGFMGERLEAAALARVGSECAAGISSSLDPVRRVRDLRAALRPSLRDSPVLRELLARVYQDLLAREPPAWNEAAHLASATRPLPVPDFARSAARDAFHRGRAGLQVPPEVARACLQFDVTLRGAGLLVYQRGLVPRETALLKFESGSQTKAYLKLLDGAPSGALGLTELSPRDFKRVMDLAERTRDAHVKDLGQQYVWEVELLWVRCRLLRGDPIESLRARSAALLLEIRPSGNLPLLYSSTALERTLVPVTDVPKVIEAEEELVEECLAQRPSDPSEVRDRNYMLAKSAENLLRDYLILEEWERARDLLKRVGPEFFEDPELGHVRIRHPETTRLVSAWSDLASDPRRTIAELRELVTSEHRDLQIERACATLLSARAHLALGQTREAERALNSLRVRPGISEDNWWGPLARTRDRLMGELGKRK